MGKLQGGTYVHPGEQLHGDLWGYNKSGCNMQIGWVWPIGSRLCAVAPDTPNLSLQGIY